MEKSRYIMGRIPFIQEMYELEKQIKEKDKAYYHYYKCLIQVDDIEDPNVKGITFYENNGKKYIGFNTGDFKYYKLPTSGGDDIWIADNSRSVLYARTNKDIVWDCIRDIQQSVKKNYRPDGYMINKPHAYIRSYIKDLSGRNENMIRCMIKKKFNIVMRKNHLDTFLVTSLNNSTVDFEKFINALTLDGKWLEGCIEMEV